MARPVARNGVDANRDQNELFGRAQLDLVSLANNYVDAIGNLQLAQLELNLIGHEHRDMLTKGAVLKVKVATAERKMQIFRAIAEAALEAAEKDLQLAEQEFKSGLAPEKASIEAKSRLRMLKAILAQ